MPNYILCLSHIICKLRHSFTRNNETMSNSDTIWDWLINNSWCNMEKIIKKQKKLQNYKKLSNKEKGNDNIYN